MEIKIEPATIRFLEPFLKIEQQCFDQEAFTKQQIAYLLTDFHTIAFVAKVDGEIAGFIIAQVEIEENTEFGHIVTINVAPSFRRKKVATKMIQQLENALKQRSISQSRLEVREDNYAAIRLYQDLDYQTVGKLDRYYGKKHGLFLQKTL